MRLFLMTILLFTAILSFAQVDSTTLNFLNKIIERTSDTSIIGYTKTLGSAYYDYVERYAFKKKVWDVFQKKNIFKLSKKDRESIRKQILMVKDLEWGPNLLFKSELFPEGEANNYYLKYPTREIYQFTVPIFIRNNSIALIMVKKHFPGNLGGSEEIAFYTNLPNGWTRLALVEKSSWGDSN
jgi:hypothetical protein